MALTAQQKFNAFMDESRETSDAVRELERSAREHRGEQGYAYAAGVFAQMLQDVIMELPKARRADYRASLLSLAQKEKNRALVDTLSS